MKSSKETLIPGNNDLPEFEHEFRLFRQFLQKRGLKLTRQREFIFREIFRYHGHFDADELAARLRKKGIGASRATVYRTLDLLVRTGLVKQVRLGSNQRMFEHIHKGEHHDHLICENCGVVIEFYSESIEKAQNKICREYNFKPQRHTMVISGLCSNCRKSSSN